MYCNTEVAEEDGFSGDEVNLLVEVDEEEQLSVKEGMEAFFSFQLMWRSCNRVICGTKIYTVHSTSGGGHTGEVGVDQQPYLLKKRSDGVGATVRRKALHTELLLHRNEELRKVKLSCFVSSNFVIAGKFSIPIFTIPCSEWSL